MRSSPIPSHPRPIGIIGAGIAGLCLALHLRQRGAEPIVFERRSRQALEGEGSFLSLAPNAINALRGLRLADAIITRGAVTTGIEILDERGRRIALADASDHLTSFGAPTVTIRRGALMAVLAGEAERAGIAVRYETALSELALENDWVRVGIGEPPIRVSWLAACDGLRSTVRRQVLPDYPEPRFTGIIGTGGVVEGSGIASIHGLMRMVFGHRGFFGYLKDYGGPLYWFNSYPAVQPHPGLTPGDYAACLRELHRADPAFIADILATVGTIDQDYPIFDMPHLPAWHRGRVVLVGDAAHAVGPHAGQGAAMAIEDAAILAHCVAHASDLTQAFMRFETMRRPRIEAVAALTSRNRAQKQVRGWLDRLLRRLILPIVLPAGIRASRELFAYRIEADLPSAEPASKEYVNKPNKDTVP